MTKLTQAEQDRVASGLERVRALHSRGFATAADETWNRDPVCNGCEGAWPCETIRALEGDPGA